MQRQFRIKVRIEQLVENEIEVDPITLASYKEICNGTEQLLKTFDLFKKYVEGLINTKIDSEDIKHKLTT